MRSLITIFIIVLLTQHCFAEIINVPDDIETIQGAINASDDGDTVLVAPGTYVEKVDFCGKAIVVSSLFLTTRDTAYVASTIIDGDSSGTVVTFNNDETEATLLTGFTIRNGGPYRGGGIYCGRSSPTMTNLLICENFSNGDGGGIYCYRSSPTLTTVTIRDNTARDWGGGFYSTGESSPTLVDVTISGNSAIEHGGGGISTGNESNPILENVRILENRAATSGGGISFGFDTSPILTEVTIHDNSARDGGGAFFSGSDPELTFVTIYDNTATVSGGGIHCFGSNAVFVNVTVSGNTSEDGGGIYIWNRSNLVFVNSIFWANRPQEFYFGNSGDLCSIGIFHSDIDRGRDGIRERREQQDEVIWGESNISVDPLCVNRHSGDFQLTDDSPCIDSGTAFFVWHGSTIVNLSPDEYFGDAPDMGAFEYKPNGVSRDPLAHQLTSFSLSSPFPNPFNATTHIGFNLPAAGNVSLAVYDLAGREVARLTDGVQVAGRHEAVWTADGVSSGVYVVKLAAGEFKSTHKIVLIR